MQSNRPLLPMMALQALPRQSRPDTSGPSAAPSPQRPTLKLRGASLLITSSPFWKVGCCESRNVFSSEPSRINNSHTGIETIDFHSLRTLRDDDHLSLRASGQPIPIGGFISIARWYFRDALSLPSLMKTGTMKQKKCLKKDEGLGDFHSLSFRFHQIFGC